MQLDILDLTDTDILRHMREIVADSGIDGLRFSISTEDYMPFCFTDGHDHGFGRSTEQALADFIEKRKFAASVRIEQLEKQLERERAKLAAQQEAEL